MGGTTRTASLVLRGRGFQVQNPQDNVLYLNSVRQPFTVGDCSAPAGEGALPRALVGQVVSDEEIDLCRVPVPDSGEFHVQVAVGDQISKPQIFRVYPYGRSALRSWLRSGADSGAAACCCCRGSRRATRFRGKNINCGCCFSIRRPTPTACRNCNSICGPTRPCSVTPISSSAVCSSSTAFGRISRRIYPA